MPAAAMPRGPSPTMATRTGLADLKMVGFVEDATRQLSNSELWTLWNFEAHAFNCKACKDPYAAHRAGKKLCDQGHQLAQEVAATVYSNSDATVVYSKQDATADKQVRVQVPAGHNSVLLLLKAMERGLRHRRQQPIVSYDRTYYVAPRPVAEAAPRRRSPSVSSRTSRASHSPDTSAPLRRTTSSREPRRSASQSQSRRRPVIVDQPDEYRQPSTPPLVYESDSTATPPASPKVSEPENRLKQKSRPMSLAVGQDSITREPSARQRAPPSSYRRPTVDNDEGLLPSFNTLSAADRAKYKVQTEEPKYNTAVRAPSDVSSSSSARPVRPRRNSATFFR